MLEIKDFDFREKIDYDNLIDLVGCSTYNLNSSFFNNRERWVIIIFFGEGK